MAAWSREDLVTLVEGREIYVLDASAALVPLPPWLLTGGATELNQSIAQRMELVHPDDRATPGEMFLSAIASPGQVVPGEYRIRADDRWFIRSVRMVNLVGSGLLDGILVAGANTIESTTEAREALASRVHGEFTPANWLVEILDERAIILEIDGMVHEIWGCPPSELIGSSATRFLAPECFASAAVMWSNLMAKPGATAASRQRVIRPDGSSLWIDSFLVSRPEPDGTIRVMNFINDVTEQRSQQMAIEQLADEFRSLAEQVPAAIFRCDRSGAVSFHNELWESLCSADPGARRLHDLIHPAAYLELDAELARLASAAAAERGAHLELRGARGDVMLSLKLRAVGQQGSDQVTFVGSIEDITSTMTLRRRANHDPLTGLMNREGLAAYLHAAMTEYPEQLLIGFIDLDGFKSVNDTFDHAVGDRVLASIAERLRRAFRSEDVVARYGGDEFVVVCKTQAGTSDGMVTSGVERALAEPVLWEGGSWNAKASIGTARVEPDDDVADLLRRADRNMYLAKAERRLDQAAS
jgi:diguanylate cyclase (GGDEF)-like protein/PAS domain S-box-containing protein